MLIVKVISIRNVWGFLAIQQEDSLKNTPVTSSKNARLNINNLLKCIMEITMKKEIPER